MICCDPFPWYPFFPSKWLHALLISVSTWFAATLPTIWTSPTTIPQLQIIAPLLLIRWTQLTGWIRNLVLICSGPLFDDPIMIYNIIHDDTNMISYIMIQIWYMVSYLMIQILYTIWYMMIQIWYHIWWYKYDIIYHDTNMISDIIHDDTNNIYDIIYDDTNMINLKLDFNSGLPLICSQLQL